MKVRKKKHKLKQAERDLQEKMGMFDKLPDACDACKKDFNKKDKTMVQSWNVVVREAEGVVRLYCPECWNAASKAVEEVMKNE
jgi:excinuclease UvrABC helicase subunit UvrB